MKSLEDLKIFHKYLKQYYYLYVIILLGDVMNILRSFLYNTNKKIITIDREHGTNAEKIAKELSDKLRIQIYDEPTIDLLTIKNKIDPSDIDKDSSFLQGTIYDLYRENRSYNEENIARSDGEFLASSKTIRDIAKKEGGIFLGKCANYVLKESKPFRIFLTANKEDKIKNLVEQFGYSEDKALTEIEKMDLRYKNYYNRNTLSNFANPKDYDIIINSSSFDINSIVEIIVRVMGKKK